MKSIATDIRALLIERINESSPAEVLRIAAGLAANEQIEVLAKGARFAQPTIGADTAARPRFVNLDADGQPAKVGQWVYDSTTGLLWGRSVLEGTFTWKDALAACENVKFRGTACRAPTLQERFSITDYTRHSPALDTAHFAKDEGWEWTSTPYASSPSVCAWDVYLGGGYCGWDFQSYRNRVRPVLAGQSFSFDF